MKSETSICFWKSAVARRGGGANGATAPGIQDRGHPKSEITKI